MFITLHGNEFLAVLFNDAGNLWMERRNVVANPGFSNIAWRLGLAVVVGVGMAWHGRGRVDSHALVHVGVGRILCGHGGCCCCCVVGSNRGALRRGLI